MTTFSGNEQKPAQSGNKQKPTRLPDWTVPNPDGTKTESLDRTIEKRKK